MRKKLESENKILMAAIEEFAERGYNNASTNNIMKLANVSKGLIFHYFDSKENLFITCAKYGLDIYEKEYFSVINDGKENIFDKIYKMALFKIKFLKKNEVLGRFLIVVTNIYYRKQIPEVTSLIENLYKKVTSQFFCNINTSDLRKDLPAEEIINYVLKFFGIFEREYRDIVMNSREFKTDEPEKSIDFMEEFLIKFQTMRKLIESGICEHKI